jgi:ABC-2 type transport system permease protein
MLYGKLDPLSLGIVAGFTVLFLGAAIYAYDPGRGIIARVRGPAAG